MEEEVERIGIHLNLLILFSKKGVFPAPTG